MLRRITLGSVSITTAATHVRVLCMRYCNGLIAYILLHFLMKFHLEITKDKEMTTFLYVLSDHPTYYVLRVREVNRIVTNVHSVDCAVKIYHSLSLTPKKYQNRIK